MEAESRLISDYQEAVSKLVATLRERSGCHDLLRAWRSGKIPKDGVINGVKYSFHGIGCRGIIDGLEVDFDFGPDGRTDGFDAWRLWNFATERPAAYPQFQQRKAVEKALEMLARAGVIEGPKPDSSDNLWYLRS